MLFPGQQHVPSWVCELTLCALDPATPTYGYARRFRSVKQCDRKLGAMEDAAARVLRELDWSSLPRADDLMRSEHKGFKWVDNVTFQLDWSIHRVNEVLWCGGVAYGSYWITITHRRAWCIVWHRSAAGANRKRFGRPRRR